MGLQFSLFRKTFRFTFDARTSRGKMYDKTSWFIVARQSNDSSVAGIGECGPLPGLSREPVHELDELLNSLMRKLNGLNQISDEDIDRLVPPEFSAVRLALETALLDLRNGGRRIIFNNSFIQGKCIPINGLIWMGNVDFMLQQVADKIAQGYTTIKMKIGGLHFEQECEILDYIRRRYYRENPEIRLDANGAFKPDEALDKLNELSRFNIHSIEQPVAPGLDIMEEICRKSPIPVALDEELIGVVDKQRQKKIIQVLKPAYLILKPSLHGGFQGCTRWIAMAEEYGTGWWITSALESNIGLNAICQFTAQFPVVRPHGLGTGQLFENNFHSPLHTHGGSICYRTEKDWDLQELLK
ncbi:MAG: o-succinylbenzoate synthase [Cyclobacteriaceae bacterium]|nr:o-succinylbenzoate synthase [Cyclobacteriaceae bacterium]